MIQKVMSNCLALTNSCMKLVRWFPYSLVFTGLALFVLGYLLEPETIKTLWLVITGLLTLFGLFILAMINLVISDSGRNHPAHHR